MILQNEEAQRRAYAISRPALLQQILIQKITTRADNTMRGRRL